MGKNQKLLALLLALSMLVMVLAGCAQKPATEDPTAAPAEAPTAAPEEEEPAPDEGEEEPAPDEGEEEPAPAIDTSETQELELSCWDIDNAWGEGVAVDKFGQFILDKFNITIKTANVTWGDYTEKYNLWAAANSLPATVATAIVGGVTYYQWINEGAVRALPEDMSMFPTLQANLALRETVAYQVDGKNWFLPRMTYSDPTWWCMDRGILYRKDWLENLGLSEPTNEQEFIDMCVAFQTQDPDGNGKNDTVGLSGSFLTNQAFANYGALLDSRVYTLNEDGTVSRGDAGEEAYNLACMLRAVNKAGGMDPDYLTYGSEHDTELKERFIGGRIGVLGRQVTPSTLNDFYTSWMPVNPDKNFLDCIGILPMWDNGVPIVRFSEKAYWSETYFSNKVTDEELPRYLALFDWMSSEEGQMFMGYGFEGEDYTVEEDGSIVSLMPTKEDGNIMTLADKYPNSQFGSLAVWTGGDTAYINPSYPKEIRDYCYAELQNRLENWVDPEINWELQAITTDERTECTALPETEWNKMIADTSDKTNEEWYAESLAYWNDLGLQAACDSIAEAYAASHQGE